jgi:hypothetical protein
MLLFGIASLPVGAARQTFGVEHRRMIREDGVGFRGIMLSFESREIGKWACKKQE